MEPAEAGQAPGEVAALAGDGETGGDLLWLWMRIRGRRRRLLPALRGGGADAAGARGRAARGAGALARRWRPEATPESPRRRSFRWLGFHRRPGWPGSGATSSAWFAAWWRPSATPSSPPVTPLAACSVTAASAIPLLFALLLGSLATLVTLAYFASFVSLVARTVAATALPADLVRFTWGGVLLVSALARIALVFFLVIAAFVLHLAVLLVGANRAGFEGTFKSLAYASGAATLFAAMPLVGSPLGRAYLRGQPKPLQLARRQRGRAALQRQVAPVPGRAGRGRGREQVLGNATGRPRLFPGARPPAGPGPGLCLCQTGAGYGPAASRARGTCRRCPGPQT